MNSGRNFIPWTHCRAARPGMEWCVIACALIAMILAVGCGTHHGASLALRSQSRPSTALIGGFTSSYYSMDDKNHLTILLVDGSIEEPVQAVTIRMFWKPRAGRTPIDPTATNATIHYTIFTGDNRSEVGIYSGAGFVYPVGKVGNPAFSADVWQATLRLTDRSTGFEDLLGGAVLDGHLTARRDDAAVSLALRRLRVLVTQCVGYPRWVGGNPSRGLLSTAYGLR